MLFFLSETIEGVDSKCSKMVITMNAQDLFAKYDKYVYGKNHTNTVVEGVGVGITTNISLTYHVFKTIYNYFIPFCATVYSYFMPVW